MISALPPPLCQHCRGNGKVREACSKCDAKGYYTPPGFTAYVNCECSNLRCIACGGGGRQLVPAARP